MGSLGLFLPLTIFCCRWTTSYAAEETEWTYTGPVGQSEWHEYFPACGGDSQSPVDIVTSLTKYDPHLTPVRPLGYSQHGNKPFTLYNIGHTVVIKLPDWMGLGGLPCFYTATQMHLHWGSGGPSHRGSEHTIDGQSAVAELHVVHYNSEVYPNLSMAMNQRDGLAVLGVLIETGEETSEEFANILRYLGRVRYTDQKTIIPAFDVESLLPKDLGCYYRYNGSLTTPPCYENVLWTVFCDRIIISQVQLLNLQTMLLSSKEEDAHRMRLQDNYRFTQPLNHRVIFSSLSAESGKKLSSGEVTAIVVGIMCGCVGLAVIVRFIVKTIRSTSSWDVLRSTRPTPIPRINPPAMKNEQKQDVELNSTCEAVKKEDPLPLPSLQTEP